jgi:acyl-CoA dehydrogenase
MINRCTQQLYHRAMDIVQALLQRKESPAAATLGAWTDATRTAREMFAAPVDRALIGGALADRLGFAFAAGYGEALRTLVPGLLGITALCATESGGNHPRAIQTTLANGELTGKKTWATVASLASSLLVVASTGTSDGKNRLRVVRVAANAPGVTVRATTAAFVPEIPHAEVEFDRVRVAEADVLPGDGYDDYLKPFRTVEDAHVHAALIGYLIAVAHRHDRRDAIERLVALALATRAVALSDPKSETTHVALAGVIALATDEVARLDAAWTAGAERERWQRDRVLLQVAGKARAARRDRAWERVGA